MLKKTMQVSMILLVIAAFTQRVSADCSIEWSACEDGSQVAENIVGDCEGVPIIKPCGIYDGICTIGYISDSNAFLISHYVKRSLIDGAIFYNFNENKYLLENDSGGNLYRNDMANVDVLIASDGSNTSPTVKWSGKRWNLHFENAIVPAHDNGMSVMVVGDHTAGCERYGCAYASDMVSILVNNLQDDYTYGVVNRDKRRFHSRGWSSSDIPFFDGLYWFTASKELHTPGNMWPKGETDVNATCSVHPENDICLFAFVEPRDGKGWVTMDGNIGNLTYPALIGDTPTGESFFDAIPDCMPKSCGSVDGQVLESRPEEVDLCGINSVLIGLIENTESGWSWQCGITEDDESPLNCNAIRNSSNENGECDSETVGIYSCTDRVFRGAPCLGGLPTETIVFPPTPTIEQGPITVTWGCDGIGTGTSTEPQQCAAVINPPQPGSCNNITNNGQFIDKPVSDLCCNPDITTHCETNDDFLSSRVTDLVGTQWTWKCNGTCGAIQTNCSAECKPEFDLNISPNPFPLSEDGVTIEISLNKIGSCAANYSCTVDEHDVNEGKILTFDNIKQPFDIVLKCVSDENVYTETVNVSSYCTTRECNAQGTCQSTPKAASHLNECSSTCNSNADCSSGRIIETRP